MLLVEASHTSYGLLLTSATKDIAVKTGHASEDLILFPVEETSGGTSQANCGLFLAPANEALVKAAHASQGDLGPCQRHSC